MVCWAKCLPKALSVMVLLLLGLLGTVSSKKLHVHMIANSHMDLGWFNTINEYYNGYSTRYGENVDRLFTMVFNELDKDKKRTYSIAEVGFLDIWWKKQNQDMKNKVLRLFQNGQLELSNGGWSGNDEATPMYDDIIQNFISGQRWADENLNGTQSTVGWQMDSFGTSMTQAYLLKEAGYEGTFFSRVDNDERQRRKDSQSLEFNWNFPNSQGSVFTHLMDRPYYRPILPRARWIAELFYGAFSESDYQQLIKELKNDEKYFPTSQILLLICGDFYMSGGAGGTYYAMDDIVRYFNEHTDHDIEVFYSNPGNYTRAVKQELADGKQELTDKHGDFFPLNEEPGTVWSGFFSSKSAFKSYVRWHSRYLTAARLLISQRAMREFQTADDAEYTALNAAITELEQAMGVVQHHDAVSGTERERVRFDYEDILTNVRKKLEEKVRTILLQNLKKDQAQEAVVLSLDSTYDGLLNGWASPEISNSAPGADSDVLLAVMNPGNARLVLITANTTSTPTDDACITVESSDGRIISPDIICQGPHGAVADKCAIYFCDNIEAYAWMYYRVKVTNKNGGLQQCGKLLTSETVSSRTQVEGAHWNLQINNGNVFTFLKNQNGETVQKIFKLSYSYFESATQARGLHHASGAYIFMPRSTEKKSLSTENQTIVWTGNHIAMVQIKSANFTTSLQILLGEEQTGFSVVTELAPIQSAPNGCEIVMEITVPDLQADGKFFTDTNGYFMLERPYLPKTGQESSEHEVSKNYHPMTTRCSLEGNRGTEAFTVFTDRSQGASIQQDNQINIMIHRVAVMDDDEGVDEVLNEKYRGSTQPRAITTWHYFLWSDISTQNSEREETQYDSERPVRIWLFSVNKAFSAASIPKSSAISSDLPKSLKVAVRTYSKNEHSIRLQNLDPKNILSVEFSGINDQSPSLISYLSQNHLIGASNIKETSWTTTQVRRDSNGFDLSRNVKIELAPFEMRTFQVSVGQLNQATMVLEEVVYGSNQLNHVPGTTTNPTHPTNPTNPTNSTNPPQHNTTTGTNPGNNPDHPSHPGQNHTTGNPSTPHNNTHTNPNQTPNNTHTGTHTGPGTTVPGSSDPNGDNKEPTKFPEVEEEVTGGDKKDFVITPMFILVIYLIFHICVGIAYVFRCYLRSKRENIPFESFSRDILIVAALGPIGLIVVMCSGKGDVQVKHVVLPDPDNVDNNSSVPEINISPESREEVSGSEV